MLVTIMRCVVSFSLPQVCLQSELLNRLPSLARRCKVHSEVTAAQSSGACPEYKPTGDLSAWTQAAQQGASGPAFPLDTWPLHNATAMWDLPQLEAAAAGSPVNQVTAGLGAAYNGLTPLHVALMTTSTAYWEPYSAGMYAVMCFLLSNGADPDQPLPWNDPVSGDNVTPLFWVTYLGQVDLVQQMIATGADVTHVSPKGSTALHQVAQCDARCAPTQLTCERTVGGGSLKFGQS